MKYGDTLACLARAGDYQQGKRGSLTAW